jgi:hypothetical protein
VVSPLGDKGDCVDFDACAKRKAGNLDCARCGRIVRKYLAAHLGEFGIGCKVREVDLDAHDLVHVGVKLAQGLADAIEGHAHFLLKADGLVVRWDRHAHLTRDEDPAASFGIDTKRLAEALRDRASEMSYCAHDGGQTPIPYQIVCPEVSIGVRQCHVIDTSQSYLRKIRKCIAPSQANSCESRPGLPSQHRPDVLRTEDD